MRQIITQTTIAQENRCAIEVAKRRQRSYASRKKRNLDAHYDVGADFNGDYLAPTCAHSGTHVG